MIVAGRAHRRESSERWASLQVLLLLCGCPQRLDDDFELGVAATGPADSSTPDVNRPDPDQPDVGEDNATVLASIPADGARGVLPDASLVLTFSAPMNRASVEAAYTSSELPASAVSFVWSEADRVLHIQPKAPLETSAGSDPADVDAIKYTVEIVAGARAAAGDALASKRISFSTARAISQRLGAVTNRDLTGNWRSDGIYGALECERGDTTVCVGDSPTAFNPNYRGFITFDLRQAPTSLIAITAAQLSCSIAMDYGAPFNGLGALHVDHVAFETIGEAAFSLATFPERQSHTEPVEIGELITFDALAAVRADWPARQHNQYRLAFEAATGGDASVDLIGCDWSSVALALTYWLP